MCVLRDGNVGLASSLMFFFNFWSNLCSERWFLEVIRGVRDPVGGLVFGALGRAVGGEQGFEDLRLLCHFLIGPFAVGRHGRLADLRGNGGSRGSGHS